MNQSASAGPVQSPLARNTNGASRAATAWCVEPNAHAPAVACCPERTVPGAVALTTETPATTADGGRVAESPNQITEPVSASTVTTA
nr:hypothetical protein GCM10017745_37580 [Saccharothrix mutabilis subsp. capreolus]